MYDNFDAIYTLTDKEYWTLQKRIECELYSKNFITKDQMRNIIYNANVCEHMYEDPDDLEFDLYMPLCDTAIYYFIEDYEEFEDEDYYEQDEDEYEEDGFTFFDHCDNIGIQLPLFPWEV